jgi:hypothetical protein
VAHGFFLVFGVGQDKARRRVLRPSDEATVGGQGAKLRGSSDDENRHRERK